MRLLPRASPAARAKAEQRKVGCALPGLDGTLWRLLARADVEQVPDWCRGERIRGVPPEQLFDAMAIFVASALVATVAQVGRKQMIAAADDILANVDKIVDKDLKDLMARKAQADILRRNLTLVKG